MKKKGERELEAPKKKSKGKLALKIIILILLVVAALAAVGYMVFSYYYGLLDYQEADDEEVWEYEEEEEEEEEETSEIEEATEEEEEAIESDLEENQTTIQDTLAALQESSTLSDNFNILLVGVDSRTDSNTGRSDTMILVTVNKSSKTITMTSFLRDIYVSIPDYGSNRLNAAFAYGGPDLLEETLETNFGITADKYVVVNFYSVIDFIDAIDGIDLEVTTDEISYMNEYISAQNKLLGNEEGTDYISYDSADTTIHVNGNQALAYARIRYIGTDFERTSRQREVLELALEKVEEMSIAEMLSLVEEFFPRVTTDLTQADCASLLLTLLNLSSYTLNSISIPEDGTWSDANIDGMDVLIVDFEENLKYWYEIVS